MAEKAKIAGKAAKGPLLNRVAVGSLNFSKKLLVGPSVWHSALMGAALGGVIWGGMYSYRTLKLLLTDTDHAARQSRLRYAEKQKLYSEELDAELSSQYVQSFVGEYNPAATKMPFKSIDPKYLL
eukprot:GHVU01018103.1.p1 GENE.GHVU01018103.1~~GHVU01018103.1.p1  ORF type:complete len:125 (+),score=12.04 GHVU01018103.1:202-576(+)